MLFDYTITKYKSSKSLTTVTLPQRSYHIPTRVVLQAVPPFQKPYRGDLAGVEGAMKSNSVTRSQLPKSACSQRKLVLTTRSDMTVTWLAIYLFFSICMSGTYETCQPVSRLVWKLFASAQATRRA